MPEPPPLPVVRPCLPPPEAVLRYLQTSYDQRSFSNFGPNERLLSQRLTDKFASQGEAVLACSATAALTATLIALDVRGVVAVPAFTFPAVLHAIIAAGCQPLLLDVDIQTWELSADTVAQAMAHTRIDAIMPVRVFGLVRDQEEMVALGLARHIPVIYDSAGALGHAEFPVGEDRPAYVEVFSLHATKAFGIGEGGVILCAPKLAARIRSVLNFGLNTDRSFGDGINGKMSDFLAAVGLAALDNLAPQLERRQAMAAFYQSHLADHPCLCLPTMTANCPWPLFPVLTRAGTDIPALIERAQRRGMKMARYYYPSLVAGYRGNRIAPAQLDSTLPVADHLSRHMICLPVYADATAEELVRLQTIITDPTLWTQAS